MNLTQMAEYVCAKVRKTDADSLAICKQFLNARYEMLWNDQLWRESLGTSEVAVAPGTNTVHAQGIVLLSPGLFSNIVAARLADRALTVVHNEELMAYDSDAFDAAGNPQMFTLMRPVVYQFGARTDCPWLYAQFESESDSGLTFTMQYTGYPADGHYSGAINERTAPAYSVYFGTVVAYVNEIVSLTKAVTNGRLNLSADGALPFLTMEATDTAASLCQRIRLVEKPNTDCVLTVLGKRQFVDLNDNESPLLSWVCNALLAFAQGDMLERDRQYSKAQAKQQEGMALMDQARRVEVWQQAHRARLIPEADPANVFEASSKGYW